MEVVNTVELIHLGTNTMDTQQVVGSDGVTYTFEHNRYSGFIFWKCTVEWVSHDEWYDDVLLNEFASNYYGVKQECLI